MNDTALSSIDDLPASFFEPLDAQRYRATEATIGPWSPRHQHGGPPAALLTHVLRTWPSEDGLRLSRLTVEILGPVPVDVCEVSVEVARPGRRIELLRGELRAGGRTALLVHAWRTQPAPDLLTPVPDEFTMPVFPPEQPQRYFRGVGPFPYARALAWRFTQGSFDSLGPATVWTRPRIALIAGRETDPLEALMLMLDSANGISAELDIERWSFVPVDMTLGLHRTPRGPWLGMAARTTLGGDGTGQAATVVFDRDGPLGRSLHTLFVRPR